MDYIEIAFTVANPGGIRQDLLIAGLGEAGYDSFLETETGFKAYIPAELFSERQLKTALDEMTADFGTDSPAALPDEPEGAAFAYEIRLIEAENWNEVWERNFDPVVIGTQCRIRASFHEPDPAFPLEIQIEPKMSFGTGHHETTWLMASWLLELPLAGKKVLDMGCGTGVLGILAAKRGAAAVSAADIDPVCIESTLENAALNGVKLQCRHSDVRGLPDSGFDLILANINRNVLLEDLPFYAEKLRDEEAMLLISGFYEGEDLEMLREKAQACGLAYVASRGKNRWAAAQFRK